MDNFWNQLPAILGVLVGSLGTLLVTSFTDRARWRKDEEIRWDTRRLDAYVSYAAIIKEIHSLAFRVSATARRSRNSLPIGWEQGVELLAEANARRTQAWELMLLLGDETTVGAAQAWHEAVWVEQRLSTADPIDDSVWQSAVEAVDLARDRFYSAARTNLSVHSGSVAQTPFLRAKDQRARAKSGDTADATVQLGNINE